jgi:site-specific DNA recombinase
MVGLRRPSAESQPFPRLLFANAGREVQSNTRASRDRSTTRAPLVLHRTLYRGEVVWNQTRKRDSWGQKRQQAREAAEWIRQDRPELRIVPPELWQAAHARLDSAREDYARRNVGRAWGRPVSGMESKYLLTGLAQCALCGGGLFVHSRSHGGHRAHFYACSTYYHLGSTICRNSQVLPMPRIDAEVLAAFQEDLLNPAVLSRAIDKLADRLRHQPRATAERAGILTGEAERLQVELARLTAALATGAALPSVLDAIREREDRRQVIAGELAGLHENGAALADDLQAVLPAARKRLEDWRSILAEETARARQMLRTLLTGCLVFTPQPEAHAVLFRGRGDYGQLFAGLVHSQALASPTGTGRLWYWDVGRLVSLAA